MAGEDLSRLRIDRSNLPQVRRRGRYGKWLGLLALLALAIAAYIYVSGRAAIPVEVAVVAQAYPSQAYTLLNATGYVVAQRKAAVASKATGRLEWLGVREGSQVKKGEVIARLESLDVAAARDQAAANVRVNAICPGPFLTELNKAILDDPEKVNYFMDRLPMKRFGAPEELVGSVVFLASEASSYITGTTIYIDGGWTAQ